MYNQELFLCFDGYSSIKYILLLLFMKAAYKFFLRIFVFLVVVYLFGRYFTDVAVYVAISMVITTILLPLTEKLVHVSFLGVQLSRTFVAFFPFFFF